jgi:hypothetical protein
MEIGLGGKDVMKDRSIKETYLGDGLYASFDGFTVILRAPRNRGDHWVGLEPQVWNALVEFMAEIKGKVGRTKGKEIVTVLEKIAAEAGMTTGDMQVEMERHQRIISLALGAINKVKGN